MPGSFDSNLLNQLANPTERMHSNILRQQKIDEENRLGQSRNLAGAALRGEAGAMDQLSGVDPDAYMALETRQKAQASERLEKIAATLYSARGDPQKWAQAIGMLREQGFEFDPGEDLIENADALFGQVMGLKDQVDAGKPLSAIGKLESDRSHNRISDEQYGVGVSKLGIPGGAQGKPPAHYQWSADGTKLVPIEGGAADAKVKAAEAKSKRLTGTELRFKRESENNIVNLTNTVTDLKKAKALARKSFEGTGASARAYAGAKLPDGLVPDFFADPAGAKATREFMNIMSPAAIQQMSDTLKGATTDRELFEFKDILADPSSPMELKLSTIDRMAKLAADQLALEEDRVKEFEGEAADDAEAEAPPADDEAPIDANHRALLEHAVKALEEGVPEEEVLRVLQEQGIDPEALEQ